MVARVVYAKRLQDHLGDAAGRPDISPKAKRLGSVCQQRWNLRALLRAQPRHTSWPRMAGQQRKKQADSQWSRFR